MNLTIENHHGQLVADSREVAAMLGRHHGHLMRSIRTYCRYLNQSKIGFSDFFIESTYQDETGRTLPCYKLTEKGCDFVANKTTGEKGAVFTAQYVSAFHAMRDYLLELQSPVWQDTSPPQNRARTQAARKRGRGGRVFLYWKIFRMRSSVSLAEPDRGVEKGERGRERSSLRDMRTPLLEIGVRR